MRIVRFAHPAGMSFGAVHGDPVAGGAGDDAGLTVAEIKDHPFGTPSFTGRTWPLGDVRLLAPILPSKVVGIGKNYPDHAAETTTLVGSPRGGRPTLFLKPSTSVVGPGAAIRLPWDSDRVDHEAELAVVIGTVARDVAADAALDAVLGYTCANDVTARDQQHADGQWTRAKSHDTFCPLGPWIETDLSPLDPFDLEVSAAVDGVVRQRGRTSEMVHDVRELVSFVSSVMTLLPGDVILTGTPAGVGPLAAGQTVSVTVQGIGTLSNPVENR